MHPILFNFFGIPIYSYGVLVATGVLISLWYGRRQAPRAGIDPDKLWNMGIYFVLVALLVAKIWLILSAWDFYMANPREIFSVATFQSGGTFYGGVVGGVLTISALHPFPERCRCCPRSILAPPRCPSATPSDASDVSRRVAATASRRQWRGASCSRIPWPSSWPARRWEFICIRRSYTKRGLEFLNFLFLMWLGKRQRFVGEIFGDLPAAVRHGARHHRILSRRSRPHYDVSRHRFADAGHEPGVDSDRRVSVVARAAR